MFSTLVLFLTEHSNVASNSACGTAGSALLKTTQISSASFSDANAEGTVSTSWLIKLLDSVLSPFHGVPQSHYQQIPERKNVYWTAINMQSEKNK